MSEQQRVSVPTGRFRAKVTEHDMGQTKTENPQVAIGFAFEAESEVDGAAVGPVKHNITAYLVFTEKTISGEYGVCASLRALGWDPDENGWKVEQLARKTEDNPDGGVLVGREADITVEYEEYDGKSRPKVKWINPPGGGLGLKDRCNSKEEVGSMAERIRALTGTAPAPQTAPVKPAAPARTAAKASAAPASSAKKGAADPF
jgi:hypothetical protein